MIRKLSLALALTSAVSVAAYAVVTPHYVDAYEALGVHDAGLSSYDYSDALDSLKTQFDYICGDTFCEGEYWNLASLAIECSIDVESRGVGQCVWTLAGSYGEVDATTGKIAVKKDVFECDFGMKGKDTDLAAFFKAAAVQGNGYDGLQEVTVPGTDGKTLMDVIGDCL